MHSPRLGSQEQEICLMDNTIPSRYVTDDYGNRVWLSTEQILIRFRVWFDVNRWFYLR